MFAKTRTINRQYIGKDIQNFMDVPNLIAIQTSSYEDFLQAERLKRGEPLLNQGLQEAFTSTFPIESPNGDMSLEFEYYELDYANIKFSELECKQKGVTYSVPLKARIDLTFLNDGHIIQKDIYMGDIPLMTDRGTFIINGAERVVVSQIHRSPGVIFQHEKGVWSSRIIPYRGSWLEFEIDQKKELIFAKIDRKKKILGTIFLRALGYNTREDIIRCFYKTENVKVVDSTEAREELVDKVLASAVIIKDDNGEEKRLFNAGTRLHPHDIDDLVANGIDEICVIKFNTKSNPNDKDEKNESLDSQIIINCFEREEVRFVKEGSIDNEPSKEDALAAVYEILMPGEPITVENAEKDLNSMFFSERRYDLGRVGRYKLNKKFDYKDDVKVFTLVKEDIINTMKTLINVYSGEDVIDDIDHLGNRRIRGVGELLQMQYRTGMFRMERTVRERMSSMQPEMITGASSLINIKPVTAAVKEFFGSSQLSQFMDQNNPLSELTHKRRLSALGPGGLSRDRAGFEVRDVHYSHYGRMCPVETPEGPNIGLINSLASYARINEYGFIEAPYRKADKSDPNNPRITDEVVYMTADDEDRYVVAQANEILDENGCFVRKVVSGRFREETSEFPKSKIDFMDVSPKMVFSVATAMIPFLENDDANRALMGSNMQRQAVPLLVTEPPVVGTGMERKAAVDSGNCVLAENDGVVTFVASDKIVVDENGSRHEYKLEKFVRSNQGTCMNQRPIVSKGDTVTAGQVIADGPSTANGEIALGKNPLIGFMTWEGYNYEDAVLLSERLVKEDVYTSVHINEYEIEARETKLGAEEITKDVPGVGQESLKYLDSRGIIMPGTEVRAGDILVGKVTPKGETELTAEERLLRAIFAEKAREVRNASLYVPHGEFGIVVDVKIFDREDSGSDLQPGVNRKVRVYIAQKRKIQVGDKMAGRHGNKGVVSRVLPVEDMPFLPNGRPLDIVLNPLGVPSRMNIGQVLEIHLSLASKVLGFNVATPVFDGANENDIMDMLEMANDYVNTPLEDFEAKYKDILDPEVMDYLLTNQEYRKEWAGVPINRDGKVRLRDGRTGEYFDGAVTIGFMHYLKLHHLVDDKIHARSTGPYSLVTQQPLGGKAQFGGQRFGEMEVWALEAYGAAYTLQEILTVKSDDVIGRVKAYEAIIKGDNVEKPGIPESFKVLLKELQSLALDVTVLDEEGQEIPMTENLDTGDEELTPLIEEEPGFRYNEDDNFADAGYHESSADEESGVFGSFEIGELDDDEDEEPLDDDLEDDEFTDSEIICPNCGAVIGYGETECSECGTKL